MKLITKAIIERSRKLGAQDVADPIVIAKFFNPTGAGTWFLISYDDQQKVMFCYASLFNDYNNELGYKSIEELESFRGRFGLGIERDLHFEEMPLSQAKIKYGIV
jgi:hypothetical protein